MKITKIPSVYFIYLPGSEEEPSQWLNVGLISQIWEYKDKIAVKFENEENWESINGKKAEIFKEELNKLMKKYS